MALLERIISMQQSGMSDAQIIDVLKEEGISPKEISEALSQSKIKSAVSLPSTGGFEGMEPSIMTPMEAERVTVQATPSANFPSTASTPISETVLQMTPQTIQTPSTPFPPTAPAETYAPETYPPEAYYPPYPGTPIEAYPEAYPETYYAQALDVETVRDIARQEIEEALKKIKAQIDAIEKMKTEIRFELQTIENRLARVEGVIQEVQSSIIKKMGEYGEAISSISNEIKATQQSFSKMLVPIMESRKISLETKDKKIEEKPKTAVGAAVKNKKRTSKSTPSFEDYLR